MVWSQVVVDMLFLFGWRNKAQSIDSEVAVSLLIIFLFRSATSILFMNYFVVVLLQ